MVKINVEIIREMSVCTLYKILHYLIILMGISPKLGTPSGYLLDWLIYITGKVVNELSIKSLSLFIKFFFSKMN